MEGMSRQFAKKVCYQKPYQHWFVIMSTENRPRLKSQLTNNVLSSFNFKPLVYTLRLNSNFVVPTHQWDQIRRFWKVLGHTAATFTQHFRGKIIVKYHSLNAKRQASVNNDPSKLHELNDHVGVVYLGPARTEATRRRGQTLPEISRP